MYWEDIKYFKPTDNWGDVNKVNVALIKGLDLLRAKIGVPIYLSPVEGAVYSEKGHINNSYHYKGMAADVFIDGNPDKVLLGILKSGLFKGIGLYPYWKYVINPHKTLRGGFHLDIRETEAMWWRNSAGVYEPVTTVSQLSYIISLY